MASLKPILILTLFSLFSLMLIVSNAYIYDYLVLALQWAPAVCRQSRYTKIIFARFFVHGLWPSKFNRMDPNTCIQYDANGQPLNTEGLPFNPNVCNAQPMQYTLGARWPNYLGDNIAFWERQWNKHGTCTYELFDQTQYFSTAIHLYDGIDAVNWLKLNLQSIVPDVNQDYYPSDIKNAIARVTGATPYLLCGGGYGGIPRELVEIRFCFDAMANQYMNCPRRDVNCGTSTIKWFI